MICRTSEEKHSDRRFQCCLKPYLKVKKHRSMRTSKKCRTAKCSQAKSIPSADINHLFNHEAMLAVSHAIEDLAHETAKGELISTFQHFDNFLHQEERYRELARRLDAVRVWAEGELPTQNDDIDFVPIFHPELTRYWVVLFDSQEIHAILFCKQANQTDHFQRKVFSGYYSFNPFVVRSLRRRFELLSCGMSGVVNHFERYFSPQMPDSLNDFDTLLATA